MAKKKTGAGTAKAASAAKKTTRGAGKGAAPAGASGAGRKAAVKKGAAKKAEAKKSAAKKGAAKKAETKKSAAKKAAVKKGAAKKAEGKKAEAKKSAARKAAAKKGAARKAAARAEQRRGEHVEPTLFAPLTEGERADALRVLTEDPRLASMASVRRYRVIAAEPLAVKPPHELAGRRLARLVVYDYAADRSVEGCVDLDASRVSSLRVSRAQPMLAREEEAAAIGIALSDERVKAQLSLGDEPQAALHYWSTRDTSLSYTRRSAAVLFGRQGGSPALIAVVDLLDNLVCNIAAADQW